MPITTPKSYTSNVPTSGLGVSWSGPSHGPFTSGGGGGNQSINNNSNASTKPALKNQVFKIVCYGMKPNTVHKFYYEGFDRGVDCVPVNPKPANVSFVKPGTELRTDSSGKIEFNFHFTVEVEKQVDGSKYKYELAGDKKFELIAVGSSASKIVPFKNYKGFFSFFGFNLFNIK